MDIASQFEDFVSGEKVRKRRELIQIDAIDEFTLGDCMDTCLPDWATPCTAHIPSVEIIWKSLFQGEWEC